jgi:mRNA interferase RelE/StbE
VKSSHKLPKDVRRRVIDVVERLSGNPYLGEPLSGDLDGLRRLRIGNYRVLYLVDTDNVIIIVLKVGKRGDIYK